MEEVAGWAGRNAVELIAAVAALVGTGLLIEQRLQRKEFPLEAQLSASARKDGLIGCRMMVELPQWGALTVERISAKGFDLALPTYERDGFGSHQETGHQPFSPSLHEPVSAQKSLHSPHLLLDFLARAVSSPNSPELMTAEVRMVLRSRSIIRRTITLQTKISA
jgi:hypothetical protein